MRRLAVALGRLFSIVPAPAFSQSSSATVSGTVVDSTSAVLPGVSVAATNNATGVVTTVLTNESGAYNFASLLPGVYKVSAELPGFQTKTFTDVELGNAARVRLNFTLSVASLATGVEVTVAADTLLSTSSSSIGGVLSQTSVQALPNVSNNVMDLFRLIPSVNVEDNGVRANFAGLGGFGSTNIQRDGVDAAGGARWTANALTATHMSPDLIGEVRIVVAPVDAEMGRGNAQLQFLTRSGTNQFRGSAVWNARNSALDANTWNNNNDIDSLTGAWKPTAPDWHNVHNFTGSYGGPIVKNKTFFFALWDQSLVSIRTTPNPIVLTPCARNGVFRYFDTGSTVTTNMWNNGNAIQVIQPGTATPTIAVVDGQGNPLRPATNPNGTPFTGALRYASVLGRLTNVPPRPDCSDAVVQGNPWDTNRRAMDSTGFVKKLVGVMPAPNNWDVGDGLNTAGHRWVRRENNGNESIFSLDNEGLNRPDNLARKQINTKIDHHFNQSHKLGVTYTYEHSYGTANFEPWPGGFRGGRFRRPQLLSVNFTSTLSANLVNEARGGMRRTGGNSFMGLNDPQNGAAAQAFFPNYSGYPTFIGLGTGQVNFQTNQMLNSTSAYNDITGQVTWADSLSWTKGEHAFKFGGEVRRSFSRGYDAGIGITSTPRAVGGDAPNASIPAAAMGSANIPGLGGTTTAGNQQRIRNLLSFLAGSLGQVTQYYYMQDPNKLDKFEDFKTFPQRVRETHRNELSLFFKDDWKASTNLTLNLGVRWDYYGSLYDGYGMMPLPTKGPEAIFGVSGRGFDGWMRPGIRGEATVFEYVGKNSPNPGRTYLPNDWNNFGPAVGFAWQVPWFGAGKTTVRGGYQMTYNGTPSFNSLTQTQVTPGSTLQANYQGDSGANAYLDLTKVPPLVPVPQIVKPMQPVPLSDRTQTIYVPQPGLVNPYAQNVTLSVTRSVGSNMTVDVRYLGTLGRKQWNVALQINQPNFIYNGLKDAFDAARAGNDSSPALQVLENMFRGINIAGAGFGPVGSTVNGVPQTAGMHLRQFTNTRSNLANGNYMALANTLDTLNYNNGFTGNANLPAIPAGVSGQVLRHNGFPENFIRTNPQFNNAFMIASVNSNNYHSMQAQFTLRPARGINMQSTYTWSKNLGIIGEVGRTYTDPVDRHADYAVLNDTRVHDFRTNGTFTLPIGPNKRFLGNSTGTLARIFEDWSMSWIVNVNSGAPLSVA
ncbi:MAG: TonB-dependent receptor, partial [Acidobacteria bacterium]|nr:TonB-dependent receptor [Acidobacteriota bacterium]